MSVALIAGAHCAQADCPLAISGNCLEGFDPPSSCPNYRPRPQTLSNPGPQTQNEVDSNPLSEENIEAIPGEQTELRSAVGEKSGDDETVYLGGDFALSVEQADRIVEANPSRVILIAGEFASGKTTLVLEIFARFLEGSYLGWEFAGSRTLRALDTMHGASRISSGNREPTTERTQADDMRLLHISALDRARRTELLFSDVRGEFFEALTNGTSVVESVPLASRADMCVLVLDGADVSERSGASRAVWRLRQLLGGLSEPSGLRPRTPTAVVISKVDLLDEQAIVRVRDGIHAQMDRIAETRDLPFEIFPVSARPGSGSQGRVGLDELFEWLSREPLYLAIHDYQPPRDGRHYWRENS